MSHRIDQINELVRQELNSIILREVELPPECLVTIVSVQTSKDLRYARVFISVLPDSFEKKALSSLNRNIGHLQFLLNRQLRTKPLPRLSFTVDQTEKKAAEIENLINRVAKDIPD